MLDQVEAVDADVSDDAARPRLLRVHLPGVALVERFREVDFPERPLAVLQDDLVDLTEFASLDQVARELYYREARVGEGDAEDAALPTRKALELRRLVEREREGLFAEDVHPRLKRGLGDLVVRAIWRAYGEEVDLSLAPLNQGVPVVGVRVAPVDEVREVVHSYRHAVNRADERSLSPAHHGILEPFVGSSRFHACDYIIFP